MRLYRQRPASLRAAANQRPTVPLPTAGGDTGRPRRLAADNGDVRPVTCYLSRGRSLGTEATVEVFR